MGPFAGYQGTDGALPLEAEPRTLDSTRACESGEHVVKRILAAVGAALIAVLPLAGPAHSATTTTPTCFGRPATIVGTSGDDTLTGQSGVSDVIVGLGGNDTIIGGDFYEGDAIPGTAPDYICGGPGDDHIIGGPGNDHINGGSGNDYIKPGRGDDVANGNGGNDTLNDPSCADCDSRNDTFSGGTGEDTLYGGWGQDHLYGNAGNDTLVDTECDGPTMLSGGPGADYLESWSSSFDGWHSNLCSSVSDNINGGLDYDQSMTDQLDKVTNVENPFIVSRPAQ